MDTLIKQHLRFLDTGTLQIRISSQVPVYRYTVRKASQLVTDIYTVRLASKVPVYRYTVRIASQANRKYCSTLLKIEYSNKWSSSVCLDQQSITSYEWEINIYYYMFIVMYTVKKSISRTNTVN